MSRKINYFSVHSLAEEHAPRTKQSPMFSILTLIQKAILNYESQPFSNHLLKCVPSTFKVLGLTFLYPRKVESRRLVCVYHKKTPLVLFLLCLPPLDKVQLHELQHRSLLTIPRRSKKPRKKQRRGPTVTSKGVGFSHGVQSFSSAHSLLTTVNKGR